MAKRAHVVWQQQHEETISARSGMTALLIVARGGMTEEEIADHWGMTLRGAQKLLASMSSHGGPPLYKDDDRRWKIHWPWPW